jgi:cytochrome P450
MATIARTITRDDRRSDPVVSRSRECPVSSFDDAKALLRDDTLRQAGFRADLIERFGNARFAPIIFQHGERHRAQRAATARFFSPRVVSTQYRAVIERETADLLAEFRRRGEVDLDDLSLRLAVSVAAEVVGLTDSDRAGMARRLDNLFDDGAAVSAGVVLDFARFLKAQGRMWRFYLRDVLPAVRARRVTPREDVISHLLAQGYGPRALLTECVTYAAAGMVTTREFITIAGWHLLEDADWRARFLAEDEARRIAIMEEILRLEPVVGTLRRRDPKSGKRFAIDVRAANVDEHAMGECPMRLDPDRRRAERVPGAGLAFGDGAHRCPGASIAMLEATIFLTELMKVPGLTLKRPPTVRWNPLVTGYEVRGCRIAIEGAR